MVSNLLGFQQRLAEVEIDVKQANGALSELCQTRARWNPLRHRSRIPF